MSIKLEERAIAIPNILAEALKAASCHVIKGVAEGKPKANPNQQPTPKVTFYVNKSKKTIVIKIGAKTAKVKCSDNDQWNEYTGMLAAYVKIHDGNGLRLISNAEVIHQGADVEELEHIEAASSPTSVQTPETCEAFHGFKDVNGSWIELQDCGDGNTFISRDIIFFSEFNKGWNKANANVFKGSDIQIALNKWFDENAPEDIKANFDIDLLTMTEIFGETQEDGDKKFWPDEPHTQLPLFKDWRNRIKGEANGNRPRWWWTRSPYSGNTNIVCFVYSNGSAYTYNVGSSFGVAPCFRRKAQSPKGIANQPAKKRAGGKASSKPKTKK